MSGKTNKAGCAVIGYGGMGGWHTRHLLESDVGYLCGVWDINPAKLELAKANGIRAYGSEAELLADPDISVVTVATPNDSHAPIVERALRAGKNVISEKPVTLNSKLLDEMIKTSEETGKLFTCYQCISTLKTFLNEESRFVSLSFKFEHLRMLDLLPKRGILLNEVNSIEQIALMNTAFKE